MNRIEDREAGRHAQLQIRNICSEYGMSGSIFYHNPCILPESNRNRIYIVAGTDSALQGAELPRNLDPVSVIRRAERNNKLFYPKLWAFDLSANNNQMKATEELVEYLKKAEFLQMLYSQYGMELPEKIRVSEVSQLIDFYETSTCFKFDQRTRDKAKKDLDWFFRREKSTGFRRRWLDYFRSEHFPDDKGAVAKILGYFRKDKQKTSIRQLMEVNEDVHKLQMQEHEYKLFTRFLRSVYPDIVYAASEKEIVNHGGVGNPKETHEALGRRITGEEYAVIRKERFAEEGWSALEDLKMAYWEFRDVYFKACDEPLVAAAYNSITLQYAKCDALSDLHEPLHMIDVPVTDFMNFVSLAKANCLRFYIDNVGDYAVPSLENVHVLYSEHQTDKLRGILERMMDDKVEFSHVLEFANERPALSQVIQNMENLRIQHKPDHIITPNRGRE